MRLLGCRDRPSRGGGRQSVVTRFEALKQVSAPAGRTNARTVPSLHPTGPPGAGSSSASTAHIAALLPVRRYKTQISLQSGALQAEAIVLTMPRSVSPPSAAGARSGWLFGPPGPAGTNPSSCHSPSMAFTYISVARPRSARRVALLTSSGLRLVIGHDRTERRWVRPVRGDHLITPEERLRVAMARQ